MSYSWPTLLAHLLNIPLVILALALLVEKANKCLDFTLTIFMFHVIFTCLLYRMPNTLSWWLWHALTITVTVLSSEYVCLKIETAEIKLDFGHIVEKGKDLGLKGA